VVHSFRKPFIVMTTALAITILASVNTTFAEIDPTLALTQNFGLIDLGTATSVDAGEMALVSQAARQIQLAKTPEGAKVVAQEIVASTYKWNARQMSCLNALWNGESHWNFKAHNYSSGAVGIAQALPGDKMDVVATDWRTNPVTQIKWGIRYIKIRYGTPCKALATTHWRGYY